MKKIALLFLTLLLFSTLHADDEEARGDIIVLPRSEVVNGDYFAYGKSIEISGVVNGDVYAFATQVIIDGTVNGNVLVAGGSINITGEVTEDVRVIAGQLMLSGQVGRSVSMLAGNAELFPSATIGNNLIAVVGNMDLAASLKQNARIYASNLRVSNGIKGKLRAYVGSLRLTSKANIGEYVEYWSNNDAMIDPSARISEGVIHHPSFFYNLFRGKFFRGLKIGSRLATLMMNFIYTFLLGVILMRYFPKKIELSLEALSKRPLHAFLAGIVLVIILPIICLILLVSILGVPFALTLMGLNIVGFYTVKILAILWMTKWILKKVEFDRHRKVYFLIGLFIYFVLTQIPYVGIFISLAALFFGMGALVMGKNAPPKPVPS